MAEQDLRAVAFPRLDQAHMATLGRCAGAVLKRYRQGETLFEVGDRDFKFFVIKSGEVEIVDDSGDTPKTIAVLGPGEFTGDVAHLTGRPSVVSCAARSDCEVYEVSAEGLRNIINRSPELGDIILQAFIARRQLLRESKDFTGLRVIGIHDLRGQKVRVLVPSSDRDGCQWTFTVQMLWSSVVGDSLYESGGLFTEIHEEAAK